MTEDHNRKGFDIIAEEWAAMRKDMPVSKLVEAFSSGMKPGGTVLDVGCGSGYPEASYLSDCGMKVTGIDISEKMLQKAAELNIKNARFIHSDFFDFSPDEQFDGIIAIDSLFYIPIERQREVYARLSKWIRPGGTLLFTHGNVEMEGIDHVFGELFISSSLDKETVLALLTQEGFEVEKTIDQYDDEAWTRKLVVFARKI